MSYPSGLIWVLKMIDFLIRVNNEAEWLPLIIQSILAQEGAEVNNILVLDNRSTDNCENTLKYFSDSRIIYKKYDRAYRPGEMLNYGIEELLQLKSGAKYLSIISAHCYFVNNIALKKILSPLLANKNARAAFGRQVPMNISDPQAIRDLTLLYPSESRTIKQAAAFNNAFSLIAYDALREHLFDVKTSNLEDVIWAAKEIELGNEIIYAADAEVVHHHGPHHSNNIERLRGTKNTIELNEKVFNTVLHAPKIDERDILPIFADMPTSKTLLNYLSVDLKGTTRIIWADKDSIPDDLKTDSSVIILHRAKKSLKSSSMYQEFYTLLDGLNELKFFYPYLIFYDNSYDDRYSIVDKKAAKAALEDKFFQSIWPVVESQNLIFTRNEDGSYVTNSMVNNGVIGKIHNLVTVRGNGLVVTRKALSNPAAIFDNCNYIKVKDNES